MTTLTDLTMAQFATAYGTLTGIPTSPKSCNGKSRWQARIEALMAEKCLSLADVLDAAGIGPKPTTAPPIDEALEQDVAAAEATFTTPAAAADPEAPEPAAGPASETAEDDMPLDTAGILASETLASECRDILLRYLTDAGLDAARARAAAERAVKALPLRGATAPRAREGTKQDALIAMLRRPEGATIPELAQTLGWAEPSVRGAIAAGLKKRLGLDVVSEKGTNGARTYRIPAAA